MTENLFGDDVGAVLSESITGDEVFVVDPAAANVSEVVYELHETPSTLDVRLLADREALKAATVDFVVASHVADLVADGALSIRCVEDLAATSLFVSPDRVVSVVDVSDSVGGLVTTDDAFVSEVYDHYDTRWADAEPYTLTAPPLSQVRETLAAEMGEQAVDDFDAFLEELPDVRREGDGLDEVTVCMLVAARHGVLLYDVSRWGEDVGLASKATFSRTKGELEGMGVIETEKVPIDVGRPRLRLRLGTERLRSVGVPELARLVSERIAAADE